MRKTLAAAIAVVGIGVIAGSAAVLGGRTPANPRAIEPVWARPNGRSRLISGAPGKPRRAPADCGVKVDVYIRPKIGYCNCATGVS
jgi:hypothetical protein